MIIKIAACIGVFVASCGIASADGCPPQGGIAVPEIEEMNQLILAADFDTLTSKTAYYFGLGDIGKPFDVVASYFKKPFADCTTFVQRRDTGGFIQEVVLFDGGVAPLFAYWSAILIEGKFRLIYLQVDSDLNVVMDFLR